MPSYLESLEGQQGYRGMAVAVDHTVGGRGQGKRAVWVESEWGTIFPSGGKGRGPAG